MKLSSQHIPLIARYGAPVIAALLLLAPPLDPARPAVTAMAAVAFLMAAWWMTEAIPLAATALVPVVLFPVLGIMDGKDVSTLYFNHIIFLFLGGFLVAMAMERWNLHRRLALRLLLLFGTRPTRILLGFMAATAFLSMWISNTATSMMMVPIALAIVANLEENLGAEGASRHGKAIFLGIAYSASVGGIATLVGTPPNLIFSRIFSMQFPDAPEISFARWFVALLPLSLVLLFLIWRYLVWRFRTNEAEATVDDDIFREQLRRMGPMSFEERWVLAVFLIMAFLWLTRADLELGFLTIPGWSNLLGNPSWVNDGTAAIAMGVILFLIPSRQREGEALMTWEAAASMPWHIVLLFGGGFALAGGFSESGLSEWLSLQLQALGGIHPLGLILAACLLITFLTELTSNTATAQMFLPVLAVLGVTIGINPLLIMIPATLSCSCAFMLPVATPPNAIVLSSKRVTISDMSRTGLIINITGAVLIALYVYFVVGSLLDTDMFSVPAWAKSSG